MEVEANAQIGEAGLGLPPIELEAAHVPDEPHEEQAGLVLGVLIGVEDVSLVAEHEVREGRHQPGPIAARHEQRGPQVIAHLWALAVRTCSPSSSSNGTVSLQPRQASVMLCP